MAKAKTIKKETYSKFGTLRFDSVRTHISKNGKLFYIFTVGNNSMFVADNYLAAIKKAA